MCPVSAPPSGVGTLLSAGDVGTGFSGNSIASGTPSYADVTGCVVTPNTIAPIVLEVLGVIGLSSTNGTLTKYRLFLQVVDDLGAVIGLPPIGEYLSTAGQKITNLASKIKVTPAAADRTYKLRASMNDATNGSFVLGGTAYGGAGNLFRLEAHLA